jgi:hypothetical protein
MAYVGTDGKLHYYDPAAWAATTATGAVNTVYPTTATTAPVAEAIVYNTVEVALAPGLRAYSENGHWYVDATRTRTDSYEVAETLAVGTQACLDKNDRKIRTACAIAPVAATTTATEIKYYPVNVAAFGMMKMYLENGQWMIDATMTRSDSYQIGETLI